MTFSSETGSDAPRLLAGVKRMLVPGAAGDDHSGSVGTDARPAAAQPVGPDGGAATALWCRAPAAGKQKGSHFDQGATLSPAACDKSKVDATEFRPFRILFRTG
jgi:hypothetical protein